MFPGVELLKNNCVCKLFCVPDGGFVEKPYGFIMFFGVWGEGTGCIPFGDLWGTFGELLGNVGRFDEF